ncbi:MAG TPA: patatin-like phospholipase family protein, partial [Myxococcota bacterium]
MSDDPQTHHRRPWARELQRLEVLLLKAIVADPSWLAPHDESALRWALSLARISAVNVRIDDERSGPHATDRPERSGDVVDIGHATDQLRAKLHAMLSVCFVGERISRDGLRSQIPQIRTLARDERAELLRLFGDRLPAAALDRATRRRPLALVMGGGGGTGYVYIGALAVLDEAGIVPSLIAGTSMGALLGAFRARTKHFSLGNVRQLMSRLSWKKVFRLFDTDSRFGLPATLKLSLREVIGHEFLVGDGDDTNSGRIKKRYLRMHELAIPLRVTVAGLVEGNRAAAGGMFSNLLGGVDDALDLRHRARSIAAALGEITRQPARAIYLGGDPLTREFDVLDAVGFSASVPGLIHYDVLREDPRMIDLLQQLLVDKGVTRLVDGGLVDNLPALEAWHAVQSGACGDRDPFVLSLDAFAPTTSGRHLLFRPLMRRAAEASRAGHEHSHMVVSFNDVLSPLSV